MDTVQLLLKYGYDNSHLGYILRGKRHEEEVYKCMQEIQKIYGQSAAKLYYRGRSTTIISPSNLEDGIV